MNEQQTPSEAKDKAWASIDTPLEPEQLRSFCRDIERLFRINPMLEFDSWKPLGGNRYYFSGKNISQDPAFRFGVELRIDETESGFLISYSHGLKTATELKIEPVEQGSRLVFTDYYDCNLSEEERSARIGEVDESLVIWLRYLQDFIRHWQRWRHFAPWRWYIRRIWQPMTPTGRRITFMLLWISLAEVALILLGTVIYWLEYT